MCRNHHDAAAVLYEGIGPECGKRVSGEEAAAYALRRCGLLLDDRETAEQKEFLQVLVEWYFSGNWYKIETKGA